MDDKTSSPNGIAPFNFKVPCPNCAALEATVKALREENEKLRKHVQACLDVIEETENSGVFHLAWAHGWTYPKDKSEINAAKIDKARAALSDSSPKASAKEDAAPRPEDGKEEK